MPAIPDGRGTSRKVPNNATPLPDLDSATIAQLRARGSLKWTYFGPNVLPAWVAEMDHPTAESITQALVDAVNRNRIGYPTPDGCEPSHGVAEASARFFSSRYGWEVDPLWIATVPDVLRGVELALHLSGAPGSVVVVPTPSYPPFLEVVPLAGRRLVLVPCLPDDALGWRLDLEGIHTALTGDPMHGSGGTVLLCQPHNPLGRAWRRDELVGLAAVVDSHHGRVISDEIHGPLVLTGKHTPYASVAAHHTITVTSASKAWNFAGLKCAQVILTAEVDRHRWAQQPFTRTTGASILGMTATIAAYNDAIPWLDHVLDHTRKNAALLGELLDAHLPSVRYRPPDATYLAWLDCRALELDDPAAEFLRRGVAVNDGNTFSTPGKGFIRLNLATPAPILTEIVQRMSGTSHAG